MRAREPLLARSARAPGQLGIKSAWYRAPGETTGRLVTEGKAAGQAQALPEHPSSSLPRWPDALLCPFLQR